MVDNPLVGGKDAVFAGGEVRRAYGAVGGRGNEHLVVAAKGHLPQLGGVPLEQLRRALHGRVPQLDGAIRARCRQLRPVGTDVHPGHPALLAVVMKDALGVRQIPDLDGGPTPGQGQAVAAGEEGAEVDTAADIGGDPAQLATGSRVPQNNLATAGRGHARPIGAEERGPNGPPVPQPAVAFERTSRSSDLGLTAAGRDHPLVRGNAGRASRSSGEGRRASRLARAALARPTWGARPA